MNLRLFFTCSLLAVSAITSCAQGIRMLTLEECKEMARKYNTDIRTGKIDIDAARQTQKEAYTKYFPTVSADGATFRADDELIKGTVPPLPPLGITSPLEIGTMEKGNLFSVSVVQPIFAGGQIVHSNRLAKTAVEASRLQLEMTTDRVELETETLYWKIVSLKEAEKTLNVLDSLLSSLHKDVSLAVETGITTRNDLLTVQLKQNELNSNRLQVENGKVLSRMALCQYIGIPLDSAAFIDVADLVFEIRNPLGCKADHGHALYSLPGYRLLEKNVEVHQLKRKISLGQMLPTVGLGASYTYEDLMFEKSRNHLALMATVRIPLSDWWDGSHKIKRSRLEESKAVLQRQDGSEKLQLKMQQSWNLLTESYEQITLAEAAVDEAEENLRIQTDNYKNGITTLSELLDAQGLYQKSRNRYADACIDYQMKTTQYLQDTGQ